MHNRPRRLLRDRVAQFFHIAGTTDVNAVFTVYSHQSVTRLFLDCCERRDRTGLLDDCFCKRMRRSHLDSGRKLEQLVLRQFSIRRNIRHFKTSRRERSGLIKDNRLNFGEDVQILAAFH